MRIGSLFSGYGGLDAAVVSVLGGDVAWHVEFDKAPSAALAHRFPGVPNYGDVTAVDWATVEPVDILTGGFPCQDLSTAGKRRGLRPGTRSGLWEQMAYAIDQLRPRLVVVENVRGLLSAYAHSDVESCPICLGDGPDGALRALGAVAGDLAGLGYDCRWAGVRASDAGAPHGRFRVFLVATNAEPAASGGGCAGPARADSVGSPAVGIGSGAGAGVAYPNREHDHRCGHVGPGRRAEPTRELAEPGPLRHEPGPSPRNSAVDFGPYTSAVRRWEHVLGRPAPAPTEPGRNGPRLSPRFVEWMMGLPAGWVCGVDIPRNAQLKALGNGVVPQQAALALRLLLNLPAAPIQTHGDLLPTPAVNDMGAGKTVDAWDTWTATMQAKHGNGNGHGKSLHIEAARLGWAD